MILKILLIFHTFAIIDNAAVTSFFFKIVFIYI